MNAAARAAVLAVTVLAVLACGNPAPSPAGEPAASEEPPAARQSAPVSGDLLPIPDQAKALPADHPPVEGESGELRWDVPSTWTVEAPSSSMRIAQYSVSGSDDAECVVYYFGQGQGQAMGDAMANAERWAGQFEQPDGRPSREVMQVRALEGSPLPTQLVEITGTYDGGMTMTAAPPQKKADYMLLGAIVQGPTAPWFFKFTGPATTVRAEREAFVGMLRSMHPVD